MRSLLCLEKRKHELHDYEAEIELYESLSLADDGLLDQEMVSVGDPLLH